MKLYLKTILVLIIATGLFFNSFDFVNSLKVRKAEAFVCASCAQWVTQIVDLAEKAARWLKEDMVKAMRDVISKRLLDYITAETVKWIQGGGSPKFVSDWKGFTKDAGDIAFDSIVKDAGLARICEPIRMPTLNIVLVPQKRFVQQIDCTLDKVVKNINDFYRDFRRGGWIAYQESWAPQNNLYGQKIIMDDEISSRVSVNVGTAVNEAMSASGFLSDKVCEGGKSQAQLCSDTCSNPGSSISAEGGGDVSDRDTCYKSCMEVKMSNSELCGTTGGSWSTRTPGEVVSKSITNSLDNESKFAQGMQSFLAPVIDALINRVAREGLSSMKIAGANPTTSLNYANIRQGEIDRQKTNATSDLKKFTGEWNYILDKKKAALDLANQTQQVYSGAANCSSTISGYDQAIQLNNAAISNLNSDIASLESKIKAAEGIKIKISASPTYEEQFSAQQEYLDFSGANADMRGQIATGDNRKAADDEAQSKNATLLYAKQKFVCTSQSGP